VIKKNSRFSIDTEYLLTQLEHLLEIPSPSGYTDSIVHYVGEELTRLGVDFELTRRGAIRANLQGKQKSPDRAVVSHLDTLGAIVQELKNNGRLAVVPIGTWSSRFAEGARVTVFTTATAARSAVQPMAIRGSLLPLKASGHRYNEEVDSQPINWENVEVRVDERCNSKEELEALGFCVGDFVAIDPAPEFLDSGYIVSRHLDDKAGVASVLAATKAILEHELKLPVDCHLLFTLTEELGFGASHVLHQDVAELVTVDNSVIAPGQNSAEFGVTVAMKDMKGPFDYHLTQKLLHLCLDNEISHTRDVFRHYSSDATSALSAGNDIRTALVCFGLDSSHGYERTHIESLESLSQLLVRYMESEPTFQRDEQELAPLEGFSTQPE